MEVKRFKKRGHAVAIKEMVWLKKIKCYAVKKNLCTFMPRKKE
jgi:hypothetical protein